VAGDTLVLRVAARFQKRAGQPPDAKAEAYRLTKPINPARGISPKTVEEHVRTETGTFDEQVDPHHRDITPEDVFTPKPKNMNVLDYVRKGWPGNSSTYQDMEHATRVQVREDKGYDAVSNLSQYLVRTEGGGGARAVGEEE
jgi:hypothetical protein